MVLFLVVYKKKKRLLVVQKLTSVSSERYVLH